MPVRVEGVLTDPPGWTNVTVTGRPIVNRLLCPSCAQDLRDLLAVGPGELARARDLELEGAFSRGYAAGANDTPAAGVAS